MEWTIPAFAFPAEAAVLIYPDPGGMEDRVGLVTTTTSKQSAQDRYKTKITVGSNRHASLAG